ncbi:MAG: CoA transferase [Chloroflexi bacterium]|nr:CoA transferase [Chloroflexota bacterium]
MSQNNRILSNLRILDFSWVLAGPYATRMLADFGAEVIKVQSPAQPVEDDAFSRAYFNTWNRNKLGITLNLNRHEGIAIAKKLVGISDAVVENFAPRVMANWGLNYENLRKTKPDTIMVSLSTMGHTGPLQHYVGFGPTVHALSGMTYLTSFPGRPPTGLGFSYADHIAGLFGALALLGALEHRRKTGEGQYIDLSETEAMASLLGDAFLQYGVTGKEAGPVGNSSTTAAPHGVYRCQGDLPEAGWCAISVSSQEEWRGLKKALGLPWTKSRRFATMAGRLKNAAELDSLIENWTKERTAGEVMAWLQQHGVPAGVVQSAQDLANDPQLKARGFFLRSGDAIADANPIRLSETHAHYERAAPSPGQDNDYVFGELLGMTANEVDSLRQDGVI